MQQPGEAGLCGSSQYRDRNHDRPALPVMVRGEKRHDEPGPGRRYEREPKNGRPRGFGLADLADRDDDAGHAERRDQRNDQSIDRQAHIVRLHDYQDPGKAHQHGVPTMPADSFERNIAESSVANIGAVKLIAGASASGRSVMAQ